MRLHTSAVMKRAWGGRVCVFMRAQKLKQTYGEVQRKQASGWEHPSFLMRKTDLDGRAAWVDNRSDLPVISTASSCTHPK